MARIGRIAGIGSALLKYLPFVAIFVAIYQYYKDAGGFPGFLEDIRNIDATKLQAGWVNIAVGVGLIIGADVIARYIPGRLRFIVRAVMYYLGATRLLTVLQGMYIYQQQPQSRVGGAKIH